MRFSVVLEKSGLKRSAGIYIKWELQRSLMLFFSRNSSYPIILKRISTKKPQIRDLTILTQEISHLKIIINVPAV